MDIAIIANAEKEEILSYVPPLMAELEKAGFRCYVPETVKEILEKRGIEIPAERFRPSDWIGAHVQLVFSVGGDGSYLQAARMMADYPVILAGIHLGNLGFLNSMTPENLCARLSDIAKGNYITEKRLFLSSYIRRADGTEETLPDVLNDIVVGHNAIGKMTRLLLYINGRFFTEYPADGLICATPTGSTGYAMSCGGPILGSAAETPEIIPICPHMMQGTPLVLPKETEITIRLPEREKRLHVSLDGNGEYRIYAGEELHIRPVHKKIRFLRFKDMDFFETAAQRLLKH